MVWQQAENHDSRGHGINGSHKVLPPRHVLLRSWSCSQRQAATDCKHGVRKSVSAFCSNLGCKVGIGKPLWQNLEFVNRHDLDFKKTGSGKGWLLGEKKVLAKFWSPRIYENSERWRRGQVGSWIHVSTLALHLLQCRWLPGHGQTLTFWGVVKFLEFSFLNSESAQWPKRKSLHL